MEVSYRSSTALRSEVSIPSHSPPKYAYATLVTSASYLPGVILLAHSLRQQNSLYPLILLYTNLPAHDIPTLEREARHSNIILKETSLLAISEGYGVAERFKDTWTKLQVFDLWRDGWEKICFLDADMLVFRRMDQLFDADLKGRREGEAAKRLAANHVCVCNLDGDKWAPSDWTKENCVYRGMEHPRALKEPGPVPRGGKGLRTHTLLNAGMFIFEPSKETWDDMWRFLEEKKDVLKDYQFPDQDFITEWWRDRWFSVGWQWNALKTWRYWHPEMWRDEEVRCLHYIVDKPWKKRVGKDGKAGYLGKDGETHRWWWREYEKWEMERYIAGETEVLNLMRGLVAEPLRKEVAPRENFSRKAIQEVAFDLDSRLLDALGAMDMSRVDKVAV